SSDSMSSDASITRFHTVGNSKIRVGRFSYGFANLTIKQWEEGASLDIGSFCSMACATILLGGNHRTDWITTYPFGHIYADMLGGTGIKGMPYSNGDVVIKNDVWIGHNAMIMSGVTVGDGAVIAANAHVVKDVAAYSMVGGNPARQIKLRFAPEICDLLLKLRWWELPLNFIKTITSELSSYPDINVLEGLLDQSQDLPRCSGD
ncbi:chloramphenicol acetyltransferase, partial [mine drainage metagenome]